MTSLTANAVSILSIAARLFSYYWRSPGNPERKWSRDLEGMLQATLFTASDFANDHKDFALVISAKIWQVQECIQSTVIFMESQGVTKLNILQFCSARRKVHSLHWGWLLLRMSCLFESVAEDLWTAIRILRESNKRVDCWIIIVTGIRERSWECWIN